METNNKILPESLTIPLMESEMGSSMISVSEGVDPSETSVEFPQSKILDRAHEIFSEEAIVKVRNDRKVDGVQLVKERETERVGRENYFKLRNRWSVYLFILMLFSIIFQIILTFFVGFELVNFAQYDSFLHLIAGENFLQIAGMCLIVVQFLFPKEKE